MNIDQGIPLFVRHVLDHAVPRVSRCIDDDIDSTEGINGRLDDLLGVSFRSDVPDNRDRLNAHLLDLS